MQDFIPVKRRTRIIYLVIILGFLFLAWIVWWFFDARIKETVSRKKEQSSAIYERKMPQSYDCYIIISVPVLSTLTNKLS
ncbi:MAG: hypothetical protein ABIN36_02755 [Ferruginibacter sp.]